MTGAQLKAARKKRGWTQVEASRRLRVSQPYLSMLERDLRTVPEMLRARLVSALDLSPVALPLKREGGWSFSEDQLAQELGSLGYSGYAYLSRPRVGWNPAELLVGALSKQDLDTRLTEALPWLAYRYYDLKWDWVVSQAKLLDLQNRLGFVVRLARGLAERKQNKEAASRLRAVEDQLRESVLAKQDTLCHSRLSQAERRWLQAERPREAAEWNVLSDLSVDQLAHAA